MKPITLNDFDPFYHADNLDYLFLKIVLVSACVGWCYVEKLTQNRQIFDFLPQYYPTKEKYPKIHHALTCSYCVSGWISIMASIAFYKWFEYWTFLAVIIAPCCTMAVVGFIINCNTFYNKYTNN